MCSGKVYYDLMAEADRNPANRPALVRLEQLYSFPEKELRALLAGYPEVREIVWCQEEPKNMGAWTFVAPRLTGLLPAQASLRYAGRPDRASPAEGSHHAHVVEQDRIVKAAVG
jgi:2-oxoglutarate dehydrogenase E1 component